jgi:hypothetical protein
VPGLTPAQGSELLGARMVGRWKSVSTFHLPLLGVISQVYSGSSDLSVPQRRRPSPRS